MVKLVLIFVNPSKVIKKVIFFFNIERVDISIATYKIDHQ